MSTLADAQTSAALIPAQTTEVTAAVTALTAAAAIAAAYAPAGSNEPMTGAEQRALLGFVASLASHTAILTAAVTAILVQTDEIAAMT